jgi:hypothetical protein
MCTAADIIQCKNASLSKRRLPPAPTRRTSRLTQTPHWPQQSQPPHGNQTEAGPPTPQPLWSPQPDDRAHPPQCSKEVIWLEETTLLTMLFGMGPTELERTARFV